MYQFVCKDLGTGCGFIACHENRSAVMQAAMLHAVYDHADLTTAFTFEQACQFLQALETSVQPEPQAALEIRPSRKTKPSQAKTAPVGLPALSWTP